MTTQPESLFERIERAIKTTAATSIGYEDAVANAWRLIKEHCSEHDQRLREAEAERDGLRALVTAVVATTWDGIICRDVGGQNWFDLRAQLTTPQPDPKQC